MGSADGDRKVERLVEVARMYYEQDRTQSEIAAHYGISRPMVSKLLKTARDTGIVTIRIQAPQIRESGQASLMELVGRKFGVYGGLVTAAATMQPMPRWQRRPSVSWKAWERIIWESAGDISLGMWSNAWSRRTGWFPCARPYAP